MRSAIALVLACSVAACSGDDEAGGKVPVDAAVVDSGGGGGGETFDRSKYSDVGVTAKLDYQTPEYWLCRPDSPANECTKNLDATEVKPDGSLEVIKHQVASDPSFDCFYVYPTVWFDRTSQMTDFSNVGVSAVLDALMSQGARFSSMCRVFAPFYRQVGIMGLTPGVGADKELALQDVRDAFAYYLAHDNGGRKFVLISHSQGTYVSTELIRRDIDENANLRAQLISAVLVGGQPYTPAGAPVGGSFKNLPSCSTPGQVGCVIGWNSFPKEVPAMLSSQFGHVAATAFDYTTVDTTGEVICTEPAALANNTGLYAGAYFPLKVSNPLFSAMLPENGFTTPFVLYRNFFQGKCVRANGMSYLEIAATPKQGDLRPVPAYRNMLLESVGFGLHLVDFNIPLDDLMAAVKLQAAAAGAL